MKHFFVVFEVETLDRTRGIHEIKLKQGGGGRSGDRLLSEAARSRPANMGFPFTEPDSVGSR